MPNWCYTSYIVEGDPETIDSLENLMTELEDLPEPYVKSDFGNTWLGCIVNKLGSDWNEVSCRGSWTNLCRLREDALSFDTETAWGPMEETIDLIREKFPGIENVWYYSEEPGMAYYATNDEAGKYWKERYVIEPPNTAPTTGIAFLKKPAKMDFVILLPVRIVRVAQLAGDAQLFEDRLLLLAHDALVEGAFLVVVAEQMEHGVYRQEADLAGQGMPVDIRLLDGSLDGDDHIAKEDASGFRVDLLCAVVAGQREREHVSDAVLVAVGFIQAADLRVGYEGNTDLCILGEALGDQHGMTAAPDQQTDARRDLDGVLVVLDAYF